MAADDHALTDEQLFAALSDGLREAQRHLSQAPPEDRAGLQQRLIAITNSSKHDLRTAHRRLEALLAELADRR